MATTPVVSNSHVPWWKEPTKDQWFAWFAGFFGWLVDAFDYTVFLFIMAPIAQEFGVSATAVAAVLTLTIWLRLIGAIGSGWLADRIGRKVPLMLSIFWFSVCNFIAGFSPNFTFLLVVRAALGIGMGAEWPAGASLAMESWPARSRGLMGGALQGAFPLGFALASLAYWLLFDAIGWRGLLWIGILPALLCVYVRYFVKEPEVWVENRKRQRELNQEIRAPLLTLFTPALLFNTATACWWIASVLVVYYAVYGMFATWLQTEFMVAAAVIATPILLSNLVAFSANCVWGWWADRIGRRWSNIIQASIGCVVAPAYLLTNDLSWIMIGFVVQGFFGGGVVGLAPSYLNERFPTEVRSTAAGFCYSVGTGVGGLVPLGISYLAIEQQMGFAMPMLIATMAGSASLVMSLLVSPETKGKVFVADVVLQARQKQAVATMLSAEAPRAP
jgi:MFS transporter, SHS family, lactate transporter